MLWGFKGGRKDTDMARIKKKIENRHRRVEIRINTMKKIQGVMGHERK